MNVGAWPRRSAADESPCRLAGTRLFGPQLTHQTAAVNGGLATLHWLTPCSSSIRNTGGRMVAEHRGARPTFQEVKTYRYLRVAMVILAVGLGVSVVYERINAPQDCWQESISAYYYTPVQGIFVASLVAIGVCLITLRGASALEDTTLNLAGACAPLVAFIPTPTSNLCGYVLSDERTRDANVENNVFALIAIAGLTLLVSAALSFSSSPYGLRPSRADKFGFVIVTSLWLLMCVLLATSAEALIRYGHTVAAVTMFVFIIITVAINARRYPRGGSPVAAGLYCAIFLGMVVAAIANAVAGLFGWDYWVISIETCLLTLFAVYWARQTVELWNQGLATSPGDDVDETVLRRV